MKLQEENIFLKSHAHELTLKVQIQCNKNGDNDVLIYILRKKVTYRMIDVTSDAPEFHGLLM